MIPILITAFVFLSAVVIDAHAREEDTVNEQFENEGDDL